MEVSNSLTEALDRIFQWIQRHDQGYAESLRPGLSPEEINIILNGFPFYKLLPGEIYELYQWKNGSTSSSIFPFYPEFSPLEEAIKMATYFASPQEFCMTYRGRLVFPFTHYQHGSYSIILTENSKNSPYIVLADWEDEVRLQYDSITSMMLTIAECLETGAYTLDETGEPCELQQEVSIILRKYNPKVTNYASSVIRNAVSNSFNITREEEAMLLEAFLLAQRLRDPHLEESLLQMLEYRTQERLENQESCEWLGQTALTLALLGETTGLDLICRIAREDTDPFIREMMRTALVNSGNGRLLGRAV